MIPYGVMQPIHGHFSKEYGRIAFLRGLMLGLAVGTFGCAFAPSLLWLCVFRFITGFFAAGMIAVSLASIGDRVAISARHHYVGRFMGIVFLGQAISVGCGGVLAQYVSWRVVFIIFAAISMIVYFMFLRLPRDAPGLPAARVSFVAELVTTVSARNGAVVYLLAFATGYLLLGVYGFAGAFLQQRGGLDAFQAGGVLMMFGFACLVAGSSLGRIAARIGRKGTATIGVLFGLLAPVLLELSSDWRVGVLAIVLLGSGYVFVQSTLATLALNVGSSGLSSGMVGLGLFGGGGVSSAVGSFILRRYDYDVLWIISAVGCVILLAIVIKGVGVFRDSS